MRLLPKYFGTSTNEVSLSLGCRIDCTFHNLYVAILPWKLGPILFYDEFVVFQCFFCRHIMLVQKLLPEKLKPIPHLSLNYVIFKGYYFLVWCESFAFFNFFVSFVTLPNAGSLLGSNFPLEKYIPEICDSREHIILKFGLYGMGKAICDLNKRPIPLMYFAQRSWCRCSVQLFDAAGDFLNALK